VSPDMIWPEYDFGPRIGVRKAITLRDFLLFHGVTEAEMRKIDLQRVLNGLEPMFEDE